MRPRAFNESSVFVSIGSHHMKIAISLIFSSFLVLFLPVSGQSAPPKNYALVWSDEFNHGFLPDAKKWAYDTHRNKDGWYNAEVQYYSDKRAKNARLENGRLIIEVHKEDLSSFADFGGQAYSSARLITKGKMQWTYGFFEIRAKLPCNRGGWPAIWLLGDDWPKGGEIDIMEQLGFDPTTIYGTIHSPHTVATKNANGAKTTVPKSCTAFHDYQVDWSKDHISFFVDGVKFHRIDRPKVATKENWPFDTPQFMVLNVAMGGGWAGQKGIDDKALPARMEIDHVRVYQKK